MPTKKATTETTETTEVIKKPKKTLAKADRPEGTEVLKTETKATGKAAQSQEYKLPTGKYNYANGKRKTSIARVRLYKGDGSIFVNQKAVNKYFTLKTHVEVIKSPLKATSLADKFTITAVVTGGGVASQADAVRHGIARALITIDETLRPTLKHLGFLTRDPRVKERKKFGFRGARRGRQFSKR